MLALFGGKLMR